MKKIIFGTADCYAPLVQRIFLAFVLFPHGVQKLLGWFDGFGFTASMGYFTETMHLPWIVGFLVILIEFFGPLLLLLGAGVRLIGLSITILTLGMIFTAHAQFGFFMNWMGNQKGEGFEYFILMLALGLSLLISGGGKWAIDSKIANTLAE